MSCNCVYDNTQVYSVYAKNKKKTTMYFNDVIFFIIFNLLNIQYNRGYINLDHTSCLDFLSFLVHKKQTFIGFFRDWTTVAVEIVEYNNMLSRNSLNYIYR